MLACSAGLLACLSCSPCFLLLVLGESLWGDGARKSRGTWDWGDDAGSAEKWGRGERG